MFDNWKQPTTKEWTTIVTLANQSPQTTDPSTDKPSSKEKPKLQPVTPDSAAPKKKKGLRRMMAIARRTILAKLLESE